MTAQADDQESHAHQAGHREAAARALPAVTGDLRTRPCHSVCVALSTSVHLYHVEQIVWSSTLREADLVERQIYAKCENAVPPYLRGSPDGPQPGRRVAAPCWMRPWGYAPWLLYSVITDDKGVAIVHSDGSGRERPCPPSEASRSW
jgi:hypothetical protein